MPREKHFSVAAREDIASSFSSSIGDEMVGKALADIFCKFYKPADTGDLTTRAAADITATCTAVITGCLTATQIKDINVRQLVFEATAQRKGWVRRLGLDKDDMGPSDDPTE